MADPWDCPNCGRPQNDLMRHLITLNERIDDLEDALLDIEGIVRSADIADKGVQVLARIRAEHGMEPAPDFDEQERLSADEQDR